MQSQQSEPRRSTRVTKGKKPTYYGFDEYTDVAEMTHIAFRATIKEPETIQEALSSEYSVQWKAAADSEYQSLIENKTWRLVKPTNVTKLTTSSLSVLYIKAINCCLQFINTLTRILVEHHSVRHNIIA